MPNGNKGDDPLTDILYHNIPRFSLSVDALIVDIVRLGGRSELEKAFDWSYLPLLPAFEKRLHEMRDRLHKEAVERGWEV